MSAAFDCCGQFVLFSLLAFLLGGTFLHWILLRQVQPLVIESVVQASLEGCGRSSRFACWNHTSYKRFHGNVFCLREHSEQTQSMGPWGKDGHNQRSDGKIKQNIWKESNPTSSPLEPVKVQKEWKRFLTHSGALASKKHRTWWQIPCETGLTKRTYSCHVVAFRPGFCN